jgi:hypothetical protein
LSFVNVFVQSQTELEEVVAASANLMQVESAVRVRSVTAGGEQNLTAGAVAVVVSGVRVRVDHGDIHNEGDAVHACLQFVQARVHVRVHVDMRVIVCGQRADQVGLLL